MWYSLSSQQLAKEPSYYLIYSQAPKPLKFTDTISDVTSCNVNEIVFFCQLHVIASAALQFLHIPGNQLLYWGTQEK